MKTYAEPKIYLNWFEHDEETCETYLVEYGAYYAASPTRYAYSCWNTPKNDYTDRLKIGVSYRENITHGRIIEKEIEVPFRFSIATSPTQSTSYRIERRI